jgi:hypothetical protein
MPQQISKEVRIENYINLNTIPVFVTSTLYSFPEVRSRIMAEKSILSFCENMRGSWVPLAQAYDFSYLAD